jgi:hypothetical protein
MLYNVEKVPGMSSGGLMKSAGLRWDLSDVACW